MKLLDGKIAIITGGSRGIGEALVRKFVEQGAKVAFTYVSASSQARAEKLAAELGHTAKAYQSDAGDFAQAEALITQVLADFGKLDIVVNNAGPFKVKRALETTTEEWDLMLRGNLLSAFWVTQRAIPWMDRSENGGSVVFIGAPNAERVGSQHVSCAYSIAKTGVVILAQTLARDLGPKHIRVNVVNPGFIENDSMTPRMRQWMPSEVPLGEIGSPGMIADALLYLTSAQAAYINGAILNVHGGLWI